jgi:hypothetical protein
MSVGNQSFGAIWYFIIFPSWRQPSLARLFAYPCASDHTAVGSMVNIIYSPAIHNVAPFARYDTGEAMAVVWVILMAAEAAKPVTMMERPLSDTRPTVARRLAVLQSKVI